MIRFLLVLAGLTGYTLVYSQKIKLINTAEVVERGKQLYDSGKYSDAIKEYLLVHFNLDETRIGATGYGNRKPIVKELTDADRQINRRVEFEIYRE